MSERCGWCGCGPDDGVFGAEINGTPYHHGTPGEIGPSCYQLAQGDPDVIDEFMRVMGVMDETDQTAETESAIAIIVEGKLLTVRDLDELRRLTEEHPELPEIAEGVRSLEARGGG